MRTGEAIVRLLEQFGVDTVFGIPGTHSIELYRGLQQGSIRHVLTRHEQGAGFMADGYARATGRPGVAFVITGPGVTNIATPLGQAYSDSVPILVISPVNDMDDTPVNHGRLHEIADQSQVTAPLCAFSVTVTSTEEIPEQINRAFALFATERPRPVHINIPLSILRGTVSESWMADPIPAAPTTDSILIGEIETALTQAERPLMIAGGGCRHVGENVLALAERVPCPLLTTVAARGVIPGTHPLCVGAQLTAPACQAMLKEADFVLVLGSELAEPDHWLEQLELPAKQIWVNLDAGLLEHRAPDLGIVADVHDVVTQLNQRIPRVELEQSRTAMQWAQSVRDQHRLDLTPTQQSHLRVLTELRKMLPADCTVCSDMTQLAYTAIDYTPLDQPNTWFHPNGFGTLGYALPAAIGVKLARPEFPVLAMVGDAGLQYTVAELGVAAEHALNLVVLVWQNDSLQQIADDMHQADFEPLGVTQQNPDFLQLAQSYGWQARQIQGLYDLGPALEWAFAADGPVLLELDANAL